MNFGTKDTRALALAELRTYVEAEQYRGYDPYDILLSPLPFSLFGKWGQSILTQVHKRNPVNIRPIIGIKKEINPKAAGLFLSAYSILAHKKADEGARRQAQTLFHWLLKNVTPGFSGPCWGYNFSWAGPEKVLPRRYPSLVVTAFIMKGLLAFHQATGSPEALEAVRGACRYILKDLPVTETAEGICFSYTDLKKDCCFNANLLAAEVLARTFSLTGEAPLLEAARKAVAFTLPFQKEDGHWNYSVDLVSGKERAQIDFHQGFVVESLNEYRKYSGDPSPVLMRAIREGASFYLLRQFHPSGRALWRLPKEYPADIHHQAQGIITFSLLRDLDPAFGPMARQIADWTILHMRNRRGDFFYRKYRHFGNRISYMRWGQAWMFLALALLTTRE